MSHELSKPMEYSSGKKALGKACKTSSSISSALKQIWKAKQGGFFIFPSYFLCRDFQESPLTVSYFHSRKVFSAFSLKPPSCVLSPVILFLSTIIMRKHNPFHFYTLHTFKMYLKTNVSSRSVFFQSVKWPYKSWVKCSRTLFSKPTLFSMARRRTAGVANVLWPFISWWVCSSWDIGGVSTTSSEATPANKKKKNNFSTL